MELILLEKVLNLGNLGDQVKVRPGYGRNFLVPQGKAVPATKENIAEFETRRTELEAAADEKLQGAHSRAEAVQGCVVTIAANASDEGKLYGSIGPREIADALAQLGHEVHKSEVILGEGPFRQVGEYQVHLQLHADVSAEITLVISPE